MIKTNHNKTQKSEYKSPITVPNSPKQYRAVGLICGKYKQKSNKINQGFLVNKKGKIIDAVLLGKMFCLVENHLDLEQEQNWIVYPRTEQEDNKFQAQIMGVWQPKTIKNKFEINSENQENSSIKDSYFSIRGEVIFYSKEDQKVVIKIVSYSKKSNETKFFKLQLKGVIGNNCLGHFFNLDVFFDGDDLIIENANDLGLLPQKRATNNRTNISKKVILKKSS